MPNYMMALKGWKGYKKEELIEGKYRPVFGVPEIFKTRENAERYYFKKNGWLYDQSKVVIVEANKTNLKKVIDFNEKYASYDEETKENIKKHLLNLMENKPYHRKGWHREYARHREASRKGMITRRTNRTKHYAQIGKSNTEYDKLYHAKKPGWRISESGKKYFENRMNRSDVGEYL